MSLSALSQTQIVISDTLTCFNNAEGKIVLTEIYKGKEAKELLNVCEQQIVILKEQSFLANSMLVNRDMVINKQEVIINNQFMEIDKLNNVINKQKKKTKFWRCVGLILFPVAISEAIYIIK